MHETEIFWSTKMHETEILYQFREFGDADGGFGADVSDAAVADIHIVGVNDINGSLVRRIPI